jgi:hypothetical protein
MTETISHLSDIKVEGVGVFTPPPSPCGNPDCGWVELELIHSEECEWPSD